jgi:peptidyl-prolyl cis-trans isomerase B (cyclophilin B)
VRKARIGLLFAALVLTACDHHKTISPSQADANGAPLASDSAYTGAPPSSPRALPVTPPPAVPPSPPPVTVATTSAPETEPAAAAPTAPIDAAPSVPPSQPAPQPATSAPSDTTSTPNANPDMARLAMTPPSPTIATTPPAPSPLSELEAQKQVVVLETSLGRIVIELDDVSAPRTCGNFRKLVSDGFYDHTVFHRVIPHFMIQGGDPNSKTDERVTYGQGDPGYTLPAEIQLKHDAGAVAMARLPDSINPQRDSNGSQFFICVAPCPSLDGQYTVFGHVIQGMDVANKIASRSRDKRDDPVDRIEMKAHLETKRLALETSETSSASP